MPNAQSTSGRVYLVGAGPGDPGLITLRGVECLRRADVVLYDYLVNPRVLDHVRGGAEAVCLGRHGRGRIVPQSEINERLVREARAGKTVVRLKAGDPAVFAHVHEEIDALAAADIAFEIVPGITAALACGSYAGIPLTQRDAASALALVTGQEHRDKNSPALDYHALARFPGTLVFYMGLTSAPHWTKALMDGGKPADTPAAIVRRCSWPDQATVRTTLSRVADEIAARQLRPPVLVVVGEVAALAAGSSWFTHRPLFDVRVMVTRPPARAESLYERLSELGADVLAQPAIDITAPDDWQPVDAALARLAEFDWLVFSSANGVNYLLDRLCQRHGDLRRLGPLKLAAIGPGTADALAGYKLRPDVVPDEFRAEALAQALAGGAAGRRFLLARASRGREVLAEQLRAAGGEVEPIVVYGSRDVLAPEPEVAAELSAGTIDWVTVTSSAIARSLAAMFGDQLRKARLASISPVTSGTLRELGFEPAVEAGEYTMAGIVEAIVGYHVAWH
ncbi:MAG TPA: uroporphyrinogen-III C-methyltransferase [Pirellulales bacterium]|nr:uroporphyrinogen-III C-methyltransferase [Pirellulales bacterium]